MSTKKILLVDDDPNVLRGYERNLRKRFEIETALCSEEALTAVNFLGPFAVVVSDMNMPRENGVQLLQRFMKESPDSIRIMLTGNADQKTASDAINKGGVFRFLLKPIAADKLAVAIDDALQHYNLLTAERELLSKTVAGSIRMMTDVLSVANPVAFGRASRLRTLIAQLTKFAEIAEPWECEMAAMLSELGCVSCPEDVLRRAERDEPLSPDDVELLADRYQVAHSFISQVPRLENVAKIVLLQDDRSCPAESHQNLELPAALLCVAREYDALLQQDLDEQLAFARLDEQNGRFLPEALDALRQLIDVQPEYESRTVDVVDLQNGWVLASDIKTLEGMLLVKSGQEITSSLILRLTKQVHAGRIDDSVNVLVPIEEAGESRNEIEPVAGI